jgi:hypothetical protein
VIVFNVLYLFQCFGHHFGCNKSAFLFTGANSAVGRSPSPVLSYQDSSWRCDSRNQLGITSLQPFARVGTLNSSEVVAPFAIGS